MKKRGFTLIELLVVIAIIGLLASIVLVSVNSVRTKARNTRRLSDIKQYVLALEMYYDDNGIYPNPGNTNWYCLGDYSDNRCWQSGTGQGESSVLNNALDDYIPALPVDETLICGYNNDPSLCYQGYLYRCSATDCSTLDIRWFMEESSQSCGTGRVISSYTTCTYCRYP